MLNKCKFCQWYIGHELGCPKLAKCNHIYCGTNNIINFKLLKFFHIKVRFLRYECCKCFYSVIIDEKDKEAFIEGVKRHKFKII